MLSIKYRITDTSNWGEMDINQIDSEGGIEGFFSVEVNGFKYGYYHDRELMPNEEGLDLVSTWFENLLRSMAILKNEAYVLVRDIETKGTWLELKLLPQELLSLSIVKTDTNKTFEPVTTIHFENINYGEFKNQIVTQREFKMELLKQTKNFIHSLESINPKFLCSKIVGRLNILLDQLQ
ncbi:hypothetical protein [Ferviditalea candida]|uniref:Uncharacterized protein n=1 Tax=Ferviditalea candida TaxID=3108399 RepID=A0ABU5ZNK9_9BACL|nr:hypothetical protein [Paenibacillaceae bacterium T2]